ncbi:unnamed protein product [Pleuronectes platessa]|uniref:Uncharacterized protein n=1 Tax=Pleuronectes platessa TaxID=8262 RepID=A0A9N7VUG4_PLEPL|nr:unnamed protein product [Pleuronectes platessa]
MTEGRPPPTSCGVLYLPTGSGPRPIKDRLLLLHGRDIPNNLSAPVGCVGFWSGSWSMMSLTVQNVNCDGREDSGTCPGSRADGSVAVQGQRPGGRKHKFRWAAAWPIRGQTSALDVEQDPE